MNVMSLKSIVDTNIQTDCKSIEDLAKSAAIIAYHNFKWHYITLVLINSSVFCGVSKFLQFYNNTAVVANDKFVPRFSTDTKQFVLFGQSLMNLVYLIQWMEVHGFDNTGKFLLICQSNVKADCDEAEAVNILWDHKVVNVMFINHKDEGAVGYTYEFGKDCKNSPPRKVKNWDKCIYVGRKYCGRKFPIKFRNLYGCPVIVSTFVQVPFMSINDGVPSGADGDLLRIIIEALNATLVLMLPWRSTGWGNLDENGTWVGSLGDLYYNLANFSMTSASITQSRYKDFHMSSFYNALTLGWVTHPPEIEMPYYKLLRPFKLDAQIAIAISFIFVIIIVLFLKTKLCMYIFKEMNFGRVPDKVLFSSWELCMGQPMSPFPSRMVLSNLVFIWIWYCFLVRTLYQVHLINSLKNDVYLPELLSIEDAIAAGYSFGGGSALKDYYIDQPLVYEKWIHTSSSDYPLFMRKFSKGMRFVLAMNIATAKYFLKQPDIKLHILPEKIISCPTVIFFKKFSPLAFPINHILKRLVEFGLPDMIYRNNTMSIVIKMENEDKPIKLSNFAGCYVILLGGWLTSFILLIIEMHYIKKQSRHNFYIN